MPQITVVAGLMLVPSLVLNSTVQPTFIYELSLEYVTFQKPLVTLILAFCMTNKLTVHYLKPGAHKLNLLQLSYKHKIWILRKAYAINLL